MLFILILALLWAAAATIQSVARHKRISAIQQSHDALVAKNKELFDKAAYLEPEQLSASKREAALRTQLAEQQERISQLCNEAKVASAALKHAKAKADTLSNKLAEARTARDNYKQKLAEATKPEAEKARAHKAEAHKAEAEKPSAHNAANPEAAPASEKPTAKPRNGHEAPAADSVAPATEQQPK